MWWDTNQLGSNGSTWGSIDTILHNICPLAQILSKLCMVMTLFLLLIQSYLIVEFQGPKIWLNRVEIYQRHSRKISDMHKTNRNYMQTSIGLRGLLRQETFFLRLQPYRQSSLKQSGVEKLKSRFYGPQSIKRRVGEVVYELEPPEHSRIHNVFHVSCLKRVLGHHIIPLAKWPPLNDEGKLILVPEAIIDVREKKLRNKSIMKYLVCWKDLTIGDAI